jgi:DnaK suppressor protein
MGGNRFMEKETIIRFRVLLEMEKSRILLNAKNAREELADQPHEPGGDEGDEAQNMAEQHLTLRFKERERLLLRKIEESLQKIKEGTFGECDDCGNDIEIRRLEARPTASLCVKCKEAEEKREKSYA